MTVTTTERNILSTVKKVAGLLRISTEKTDESGKKVDIEKTLKNHKQKMLEYCEAQNWEVQTYEEVLSGSTVYEERPELNALINDIANYDAIVCMELPRLARQGRTSATIKEKVIENGTLIITLNPVQVYDLARNGNDALMYDFGSMLAEHERRVVSARVKQNKISMAKQGLNSSGSVPFGYIRNPKTKKLEIETIEVEDENGKMKKVESPKAGIVRMIFKWYLEGEGQRTICDKLNDMGVKNKQGNRWIPNSLRVLLTCATYKGTLVAHSYEKIKGKMVAAETVEIHENHEAIIEPEIWDKAQQLRKNKKERSGIDRRSRDWNDKKHTSALDGLIFCKCCERKSTIKWYEARKEFYIIKCTKYNANGVTCENGGFKLKNVQDVVLQKVFSYQKQLEEKMTKFESNDFEIRLQELEAQQTAYENQLQQLQRQAMAIRQQEQNYIMNEIEDKFEAEMIAQDKQMNQQQRLKVEAKLGEIKNKLQESPSAEQEIKKLNQRIDIIEEIKKNPEAPNEKINVLLKQFIFKIHYKRILPEEIEKLGNKNTLKNSYPAEIEIEYID